MSGMVDGRWVTSMPAAEEIKGGRFVRMDSLFRDAVSADPAAKYPAEAGRYHLFVAWGCPWAARTLAVRALKGLDGIVPVYFALSAFGGEGWTYDNGPDGPVPAPDLVTFIAGGPGQSAAESYTAIAPALAPLLTHRNVLLLDKRGTGESNPLSCRDDEPGGRVLAHGMYLRSREWPGRGRSGRPPGSAAGRTRRHRSAGC